MTPVPGRVRTSVGQEGGRGQSGSWGSRVPPALRTAPRSWDLPGKTSSSAGGGAGGAGAGGALTGTNI